jgi:hypothetical protein
LRVEFLGCIAIVDVPLQKTKRRCSWSFVGVVRREEGLRTLLNGKRARYCMNCFQKTPQRYLVKAAVRDRSFQCSRPLYCLPSNSKGFRPNLPDLRGRCRPQ